jgi:peptide/nickel transport system permease protein
MVRYMLLRLLRAALTVVLVVSFAFGILRLAGDPSQVVLGPNAPPEAVAAFRQAWGLDRPLSLQYVLYWYGILHGDFGNSMLDGRPVLAIVLSRIPATLEIMGPALLLSIAIGIPGGVFAALRRDTTTDQAVMALSVAGFTVPSFVLGLGLVLVFAVLLHWLPAGGREGWASAVLPVVTLGFGGAAVLARFTRSAMAEVLGQPYIRAASAKGLAWGKVVQSHGLPNALIPTVTIIGFMVGTLIAGAVVVESVFSWPGLGRLLVVAVGSRDVAVVQCIVFLVAVTMVSANLVVDLLYGWLDPRIRADARS